MLSSEMCSSSKNKLILISCCIENVDELKTKQKKQRKPKKNSFQYYLENQ